MPKSKGKNAPRPPLLNGDWFTHTCQKALEQTFLRFDVDRDGALNVAELQAFSRACNGGECFEEDEINQMRTFFEVDTNRNLTQTGFLQMYHTQTVARPSETWKDLRTLGFDEKLQRVGGGSEEEDLAATTPVQPLLPPSPIAKLPSKPNADASEVAAFIVQSDAAFTDGDSTAALRFAFKALQSDSECADAHRCCGRALFALGRIDAAERAWAKANELSGKVAKGEAPESQQHPSQGGEVESAGQMATAEAEKRAEAAAAKALDKAAVIEARTKARAKASAVTETTRNGDIGGDEDGEEELDEDGEEDGEQDGEQGGEELSSIEDDGEGEGTHTGWDKGVDAFELARSVDGGAEHASEVATAPPLPPTSFTTDQPPSPASITVRLADYNDPADAKLVGELLNAYASDPLGDGKPLPDHIPVNLANCLADVPGAFSVLAWVGGEPAGLANCFAGFSTFKCKPLVNVHDCYVKPFARGHRLCGKMLAAVEEVAITRGCCKLTLEVLGNNEPAKTAYRRVGFEPYVLDPMAGAAQFWQKALT